MNATKNNPHGWFFRYVQGIKGYSPAHAKTIREGIVYDYSGKTGSLSELYEKHPAIYAAFKSEIAAELRWAGSKPEARQNGQRRALFALIHTTLKYQGYTYTREQVRNIACRACGVDKLNDADEYKVIAAIKAFEKGEANAWVSAVLNKVSAGI